MLFCLEPVSLNSEQVDYYNEWLVLNKLVPPNPLYIYISATHTHTHTHTHKTLIIPFKISSNHQIPRGKKPNELCAWFLYKNYKHINYKHKENLNQWRDTPCLKSGD